MAGESDYGSTITFGGVAVGKCIVIDFPELATDKINTTNHASGGWSEGIPSGLITVGDITLMILMEPNTLQTIRGHMEDKTIDEIVVSNEVDSISGDGFWLTAKPESADAQSPNAVRATAVLAFTGELLINGAS